MHVDNNELAKRRTPLDRDQSYHDQHVFHKTSLFTVALHIVDINHKRCQVSSNQSASSTRRMFPCRDAQHLRTNRRRSIRPHDIEMAMVVAHSDDKAKTVLESGTGREVPVLPTGRHCSGARTTRTARQGSGATARVASHQMQRQYYGRRS